MKSLAERYLSGDYLAHNPSWDAEDSPWKAAKIAKLLAQHGIVPRSVGEVGCGAGGILAKLRNHLGPDCRLLGYDIAPALKDFWRQHDQKQILFILGDFLSSEANDHYDVLLIIDVIEHLENPFDFLRRISSRANWFVLHIPLDLHAQGAIRNSGLLRALHQTGHLHFWNKELVLSLLQKCGLEIMQWEYTAGAVELPTALFCRRLARWPRRVFFHLAPDLTVRTLGGYSLLVLAKARLEMI